MCQVKFGLSSYNPRYTIVCTMSLGSLTVGWCMMTTATHPWKIGLYLTAIAPISWISTTPISTSHTTSRLRMGFSRSAIMYSVAIWSFVIHDSQDFSESLQKVWNNYSSRSNSIFCKQVPKGNQLYSVIKSPDCWVWWPLLNIQNIYFELAHRHIQLKYLAHWTQWSCDLITKYKWL